MHSYKNKNRLFKAKNINKSRPEKFKNLRKKFRIKKDRELQQFIQVNKKD